MTAARSVGGPRYTEMIDEMDKELTKVIEDFDRAMNFEALRLANETSKLSISQAVNRRSSGVWCRAGARASRANAQASRANTQASRASARRASARRASTRRARVFVQTA